MNERLLLKGYEGEKELDNLIRAIYKFGYALDTRREEVVTCMDLKCKNGRFFISKGIVIKKGEGFENGKDK